MANTIRKECLGCKNEFDAPLAEHRRGNGIYCSRKCFFKTIEFKKKSISCAFCGNSISTCGKNPRRKYCDRECYNLHFQQKKESRRLICIECRDKIPARGGHTRRLFCSIGCSSKYTVRAIKNGTFVPKKELLRRLGRCGSV